jgi:uncharacterized protein YcfJ
MKPFLASILTVIAGGVLLIAYGLLVPRIPQAAPYYARPAFASERVGLVDSPDAYAPPPAAYGYATPRGPMAYPVSDVRALPDRVVPSPRVAPAARVTREAPQTVVVNRAPKRDWQKTAMVIGGSSAAGAGLGAIFGGGKGALIGAAIGGGASTLYEVTRK